MKTLTLALLTTFCPFAWASPSTQIQNLRPRVLIETSLGAITLELYPEKAPQTVRNFLGYVRRGQYDDTVFHRVISNFMIQGGGFGADGRPRPTAPPVPSESSNGLRNERGSIAMARAPRSDMPDSATAQFFINVVDNSFLDRENCVDGVGYTVFGRVVEGMDIVDLIRQVRTRPADWSDALPVEPVVIRSARRIR